MILGKNKETTEGVSREMWSRKLGLCPKKIFDFLLETEGQYTKEEIAEEVGYSPKSSSFPNSLGQLNSLGLIKREDGSIKINPEILELL